MMGIRRAQLSFDEKFTRIPNEWLRDKRISRRARGLLGELMSHRIGWRINFQSLQESGPEGREALQSAIRELKAHGYLAIDQLVDEETRKFGEVQYVITEPKPVYGFSGERENRGAETPLSGKSAPKKTISIEDQSLELLTVDESTAVDAAFDEFWKVYPRRTAKGTARTVFAKAAKKHGVDVIMAGARRFASDPNLPEPQFVKHPATWLRAESWDDEPLPQRIDRSAPVHEVIEGQEWLSR